MRKICGGKVFYVVAQNLLLLATIGERIPYLAHHAKELCRKNIEEDKQDAKFFLRDKQNAKFFLQTQSSS